MKKTDTSSFNSKIWNAMRRASLNFQSIFGDRPIESRSQAKFYTDLNRCLAGLPVRKQPAGLFVLCDLGRARTIALYYPLICALVEEGWACVLLSSNEVEQLPCDVPMIDQLWGALVSRDPEGKYRKSHGFRLKGSELQDPELEHAWDIDLEKGRINCNGHDLYGIFFNRLGATFRSYGAIGANPSRLKSTLKTNQIQADACYSIFERLLEIGESLDIPVRIAGHEANYPPTGVFKVLASSYRRPDKISFLEIRPAYQHYFKAGRKREISAVSAVNLTLHKIHAASAIPVNLFEEWERSLSAETRSDLVARAAGYVRQDRTFGKSSSQDVMRQISDARDAGNRVIVLYGCIPYDFGHPWRDEGFVHRDVLDWFRNTCAICREIGNVSLFLKPHPSEADSSSFKRPNVQFFDMFEDEIKDNGMIQRLSHGAINAYEIFELADLSLVWRGSVAVEAAIRGRPLVECAPFAPSSQVLQFPRPKNRNHYASLLAGVEPTNLSTELTERASLYLEYLRSRHMIPFEFAKIRWRQSAEGWPVILDCEPQRRLRDCSVWETFVQREVLGQRLPRTLEEARQPDACSGESSISVRGSR